MTCRQKGMAFVRRNSAMVCIVLATACTAPATNEPLVTTRDSAGTQIVESAQAAWTTPQWIIAADPTVQIGGTDGQELNQPRDAFRLSDGRIFVSDEGNQHIAVFSADGVLLQTIGRQGQGPGEFQRIRRLDRFRQDSLMVYDYALHRVSIFSLDGGFGRSFPITSTPNYWAEATFTDSLIFVASPGESEPRGNAGIYWDSTWFFLYRGGAEAIDTLGRFPHAEVLPRSGSTPRAYHLGARAVWAIADGKLLYGRGTSYEIAEYDRRGALVRLIRRPHRPIAVNDSVVERFVESFMAHIRATARVHNTESDFTLMREGFLAARYADQLPPYSAITVDPTGHVWIENYRHFTEPTSEWAVFSPSGEWLGQVRMPDGLQVLEIGADYILGIAVDNLGVNYVRQYELRRTDAR
jgi:hypothetical protein